MYQVGAPQFQGALPNNVNLLTQLHEQRLRFIRQAQTAASPGQSLLRCPVRIGDKLIPSRRQHFNALFTQAAYERLVSDIQARLGVPVEFHICETPVFVPPDLLAALRESADEIIAQLMTPDYLAASDRSIPEAFRAPNETARPTFIQVDFAVTRDAQGHIVPRLIELQGCASVHAFQLVLSQEYARHFDLGGMTYLFDGLDDAGYIELLRRAVLGTHEPGQVILMEIDPEAQKTRPDFVATEQLLGVGVVNITDVYKRGRKLCYRREGREVEIARIYNRVIIDELVCKGVPINFDYRDELDIEWAGHPNWFFRISKFSLPYLRHSTVPRSWFVSELQEYPARLDDFVLKPLFSFAGSGVKVDVSRADLNAIAPNERANYLLQEKISYAPIIPTPDEPSKVEIRLMYIWPDGDARPIAAMGLGRLSKGKMMGVDFNKDRTWVGSSACFFE